MLCCGHLLGSTRARLRTFRAWYPLVPLFAFTVAGIFAFSIAGSGVPVLRHDWHWPYTHAGFYDWFVNATSGWRTDGIGNPSAYPTEYLYASLAFVIGACAGSHWSLIVFLLGIALLCQYGAARISVALNCGRLGSLALMTIALFNPWVYNEVVAGHLFMLVGYGGALLLAAELCRELGPRSSVLTLATIALSAQFQYLLLALPVLIVIGISYKIFRPIVCAIVVALPLFVGILANRETVSNTPTTAAWLADQSIRILSSVILSGYFPHYANDMLRVASWAMYLLLAISLVGVLLVPTRLRWLIVAPLAVLLFTSGAKGPLVGFFAYATMHFVAIGVFRELYDLLAIMVVFYIIYLSSAAARIPRLSLLIAISAGGLLLGWLINPPTAFFVSASAIQTSQVGHNANHRFALFPAFQPLSYLGKGSGADPEAYARSENVTPLNEYIPRFPEVAALGRYARSGDAKELEALAVDQVVLRAGYLIDKNPLNPLTLAYSRTYSGATRTVHLSRVLPELTVGAIPELATLGDDISKPAILFPDSAPLSKLGENSKFHPILPNRASADIKTAWIDSRLSYVAHPELAEVFGGVATESRQSTWALEGPAAILVFVSGRLHIWRLPFSSSLVSSQGFQWITIPRGLSQLRCAGLCELVGRSPTRPAHPLNAKRQRLTELGFTSITPWLLRTSTSKSSQTRLITYRERYNYWWWAWMGGRKLTSIRVNGIFNGWLIPRMENGSNILIIEVVAAGQAVLEVLAACFVMYSIITTLIQLRTRGENNRLN